MVSILAAIAVILIAASAGLYLGGRFHSSDDNSPTVNAGVFGNLKLAVGTAFPKIELIDTVYQTRTTSELLRPNGTVILFTDNDCEPCHTVSTYLQQMIDEGVVLADQVIGITFDDAGSVRTFMQNAGISYQIYSDEAFRFINEYGVDAFPLILMVDQSGIITYSYDDSQIEPEPEAIKAYLAD